MALININGKCHCGGVTFKARIDPKKVMACHCEDCQILSGAPFRAGVPTTLENFSLHGEVKSYVKVSQSGNRRAQVFCGTCATPLFSRAESNATSVMIRLGCVSEREQLKPMLSIWARSSIGWLSDLDKTPKSEQQEVYFKAEDA